LAIFPIGLFLQYRGKLLLTLNEVQVRAKRRCTKLRHMVNARKSGHPMAAAPPCSPASRMIVAHDA